jgi:deoxycytidylate deaminase
MQKREDYLSWDDYFMGVAFLSAMRSKDPSTQVGACIVSPEKKILGIGYNGFSVGLLRRGAAMGKERLFFSRQKYAYVCHAELNAILNKKPVGYQRGDPLRCPVSLQRVCKVDYSIRHQGSRLHRRQVP